MNNKEQLTNATMKALRGELEQEVFISKDNTKKQLKRIVEEYAQNNNLDDFVKIFVASTTEEELFEVLRIIVNQYYNIYEKNKI